MKDENQLNMEKYSRFLGCSTPICPLDAEAAERTYLPGEEVCPFTVKKRGKSQRGLKLRAPDSILKVIPEWNLKMLNNANQKRWHTLCKGRESLTI